MLMEVVVLHEVMLNVRPKVLGLNEFWKKKQRIKLDFCSNELICKD